MREERVLSSIPERLAPFRECFESLKCEIPIDSVFLSAKAPTSGRGPCAVSRQTAARRSRSYVRSGCAIRRSSNVLADIGSFGLRASRLASNSRFSSRIASEMFRPGL